MQKIIKDYPIISKEIEVAITTLREFCLEKLRLLS